MTQKQIVGVVFGVTLVILVSVFVFRQFTGDVAEQSRVMNSGTTSQGTEKKMSSEKAEKVAPVPETIDGIAGSIAAETTLDLSALDEEEAGALDQVNQDSDSVNNLGTSYDENSF